MLTTGNSSSSHLLEVSDLKTYFHTFEGTARAVDGVSLHLDKGETLGIVGESGCGKSVTAQSIMRLIPEPPGRIVQGRILFDGYDLLGLSMNRMRKVRGGRISMIFQEPMTSLNPAFTVGDQIAEMFFIHQGLSRKERRHRAVETIRLVRIPAPEKRVRDYPHQLSGGMRQRAMIGMALACDPEILIADEPTTALDVTIQAQIIDLMIELKERSDTAIIMITHDLGVIAETAQRVAVMYAGLVVEEGLTGDILRNPRHPYTKGLLKSVPRLGERLRIGRRKLPEIPGTVPSLYEPAGGCGFEPRCPEAVPACRNGVPELIAQGPSHRIRCRRLENEGLRGQG